jgi:lipopolysaccharide/colanic/teichoic acid biosynthesis glycosyltransferase
MTASESLAIRAFDILLSGLALLLLSPLLVSVALLLLVTGEGKVFYRQQRVGQNGRNFGLLKFATMLENSPQIGSGEITVANDPRVLPVGRYLRKSKINELPQLINIFLGQMSVVGPRPLTPATFAHYGASGAQISLVRPGLTGVGSIFFRDEERYLAAKSDPRSFYFEQIGPYKERLELWYLKNRSLRLYFLLIFITALVVVVPNFTSYEKWLGDLPKRPPELSDL